MTARSGPGSGPEDTFETVEADYPSWHFWKGISGLLYASFRSSPVVVVRAPTAAVLRARIKERLEDDSPMH